MRRHSGLLIVIVALISGCGGGGDKTSATTATTAGAASVATPAPQTTATTSGSPHDCPDFQTSSGAGVTAVRATVDCDTAQTVATEVLGRDDCVEETPGGANQCQAGDYACQTTTRGSLFVVSCTAGQDQLEFESRPG